MHSWKQQTGSKGGKSKLEGDDEQNLVHAIYHGDGSDPGLCEFHFNAWFISSGKCFFATTNARMGTCQGKISKGDVMVVVAGLSMPLILTPFGNLFHVVGHAYSHGIMNGEA
jgi:hypothetical protein